MFLNRPSFTSRSGPCRGLLVFLTAFFLCVMAARPVFAKGPLYLTPNIHSDTDGTHVTVQIRSAQDDDTSPFFFPDINYWVYNAQNEPIYDWKKDTVMVADPTELTLKPQATHILSRSTLPPLEQGHYFLITQVRYHTAQGPQQTLTSDRIPFTIGERSSIEEPAPVLSHEDPAEETPLLETFRDAMLTDNVSHFIQRTVPVPTSSPGETIIATETSQSHSQNESPIQTPQKPSSSDTIEAFGFQDSRVASPISLANVDPFPVSEAKTTPKTTQTVEALAPSKPELAPITPSESVSMPLPQSGSVSELASPPASESETPLMVTSFYGTASASNHEVSALVNGAFHRSVTSDDKGQFQIDLNVHPGDVLTFYLSGGSQRGVLVTVTNGQPVKGLVLPPNMLILQNETEEVLRNTHLVIANKNQIPDITAIYVATEHSLGLPNETTLWLWKNTPFQPTGTVRVGTSGTLSNLIIRGHWISRDLESLEVYGQLYVMTQASYLGSQETIFVNYEFLGYEGFVPGRTTMHLGPSFQRLSTSTGSLYHVIVESYNVFWGNGFNTWNIGGDFTILTANKIRGHSFESHIHVRGDVVIRDPSVDIRTPIILDGLEQVLDLPVFTPDSRITFQIDEPFSRVRLARDTTFAQNPRYDQSITVSQGALDLNGFDLSIQPGRLIIEEKGNLVLQGHEQITQPTLEPGSTIIYQGEGTYEGLAAGNVYAGNLVFASPMTVSATFPTGGTWRLNAPLDIDGDLQIFGGYVITQDYPIFIEGNWTVSRATPFFQAGSGRVVFDGKAQQLIINNPMDTFHDLVISGASSRSIFISGQLHITGTLDVQGSNGQLLALIAPNQQPWSLAVAPERATIDHAYIDHCAPFNVLDLSNRPNIDGGNNRSNNLIFGPKPSENTAPLLIKEIPPQTFAIEDLWRGPLAATYDLDQNGPTFLDADQDPLIYTISRHDNPSIADLAIGPGSSLVTMIPKNIGASAVTIQAHDHQAGEAQGTFSVEVLPVLAYGINEAQGDTIQLLSLPSDPFLPDQTVEIYDFYPILMEKRFYHVFMMTKPDPFFFIKRSSDGKNLLAFNHLAESKRISIHNILESPPLFSFVEPWTLHDGDFYLDASGAPAILALASAWPQTSPYNGHCLIKISNLGQKSKIKGFIPLDHQPHALAIDDARKHAWVLDRGTAILTLLDLATEQAPKWIPSIATNENIIPIQKSAYQLPTGSAPQALALGPNGHAYIILSREIIEIAWDGNLLREENRLALDTGPLTHIAISPQGYVLVNSEGDKNYDPAITVIDRTQNMIVARHTLSSFSILKQPAFHITPSLTSYMVIPDTGARALWVIDDHNPTLITTINLPNHISPTALQFCHGGEH